MPYMARPNRRSAATVLIKTSKTSHIFSYCNNKEEYQDIKYFQL